jgi:hypothetical protein
VLASLGYEVITTEAAGSAVSVVAAVLRTRWLDAAELSQAASFVQPGGTIVVIASEGPDREAVQRLLARSDIVRASVSETEAENGVGLILAIACLPEL